MSSTISRLASRHALVSGCSWFCVSAPAVSAAGFGRGRIFSFTGVLICLLLTGCGAEKESLFEEDHDLPSHWPSNLSDAVEKIEQRLGLLAREHFESNEANAPTVLAAAESELRDLVEWIPEVAADTDLSEAQWLPIYEMCEVMREHLSRGDVGALDIEEDFHRLQALLVESARTLPSSAVTPFSEEAVGDNLESPETPENGVSQTEDSQAEVNSGEPS